ncbi:cell division protein FtsL [Staphylococcus microti]|uniref:Cell division protein FtsL n=1 Tax=Staphylococcus microti TaxID=569857 RepID=A0A0D6XRC7_9STAP|nr:cell division protein FtsL [Staphylococcus microti]KIX91000.1 cell division protein FtsL [Staphylococcus microti]PNZ81894.1 cell division protein FtsL [Staphylococcus microti]SUM57204.1 cell division protein, FtsL-like protein [Staphylococcus microti]
MAVERIYEPYQQQMAEPQSVPNAAPKQKTVKKQVVVKFTRFEKLLYISLVAIIAAISIYMLSLKMDAYDTRGKIADLEQKIEQQSSQNSALKSETMKNASYERIYDKAQKQGMSLQNENVKVVRKDGETKN